MRRWWQDRRLTFSVVGVVAAVAVLGGLFFGVVLPSVVERLASAGLGVPVHVAEVRPAWPPWRLRVSGVRLGEFDAPTFSAARVYVDANLGFWLGGPLDEDTRLEIWGPRLRLSDASRQAVREIVRNVYRRAPADPVRIASVRIDEAKIDPAGAPSLTLAGFEATDLEIRREEGGVVSLAAAVAMMSATGRLSLDVDLDDGVPVTLAVAELDGVALPVALRSDRWRLRGRASFRAWHEAEWGDGPAEASVVGGTGIAESLGIEIDDVVRLAIARVAIDDAIYDLERGLLEVEGVDASEVALAPDVVRAGLPGDTRVDVRLRAVRVDGLVLDPPPAGEELRIERMALADVDTGSGTGHLEVEASFGPGRIELRGERREPGAPGVGHVSIADLPLDRLLDGRLRSLDVSGGRLDAELEVRGPPGLSGAGSLRVRDLDVVTGRRVDAPPLLTVAAIDAEVEALTPWPPRLRVRRALVNEPVVWLRLDEKGYEVARLLDDPWSASPSLVAEVGAALEALVGSTPMPSTIAPPLGVRVSGGEIQVVDASIRPEFRMRLRRVQALLDGPAGTEGPLFVRAEGRGPLRSRVAVTGDTSTRGVSARVRLDDGRLHDFDAYLQEWTGYEAMGGRLEVDARLRLRPIAAADVDLRLETPELRSTGEGDLLETTLGAPLPATLERLAGGEGGIDLSLQLEGDPDASGFGFGADARNALRASVDAAFAAGGRTESGVPRETSSEEVAPEGG